MLNYPGKMAILPLCHKSHQKNQTYIGRKIKKWDFGIKHIFSLAYWKKKEWQMWQMWQTDIKSLYFSKVSLKQILATFKKSCGKRWQKYGFTVKERRHFPMKQPRKTYRVWRDDGFSTMTTAVSEKQAISQVAYRAARQDGCYGKGTWRRDGIRLSDYHCELVGGAESTGYRQEAFC